MSGALESGRNYRISQFTPPSTAAALTPTYALVSDNMPRQRDANVVSEPSDRSYQQHSRIRLNRTPSESASSMTARDNFDLNSIEDSLAGDPIKYMPTQAQSINFRTSIIRRIDDVVCTLLRNTDTDPARSLDVYSYLGDLHKSLDFLQLCKRILGKNSRPELLTRMTMGEAGSVPPLTTCRRALIAAAVSDWVLEGSHPSLPARVMQGTIETRAIEGLLRPGDFFKRKQCFHDGLLARASCHSPLRSCATRCMTHWYKLVSETRGFHQRLGFPTGQHPAFSRRASQILGCC